MTFEDYQDAVKRLAFYPYAGHNIEYPVLGLCGEAGELANKVKKIQRDDNNSISSSKRQDLIKELGDVLWYVAACANELHVPLTEIAQLNIDKLFSREERGTLSGSGDTR